MPITVYLLTNTGWEDCYHHGVFKSVDLAQAFAQQIDDKTKLMPYWKNAEGGDTRAEHGPLEWEQLENEYHAQGVGYNRHWHVIKEEIRT